MTKTIAGYTDRISVAPGERIKFRVSVYDEAASYEAQLVRLLCTDSHKDGPGVVERALESPINGSYPARFQPIQGGSYVELENPPPTFSSFTMLAYIWPTKVGVQQQTIMGRDGAPPVLLGLNAAGSVSVRIAGHVISTNRPLREREWMLVGATYHATTGKIHVFQRPLDRRLIPSTGSETHDQIGAGLEFASGAFTMAARGARRESMSEHFNGKIDRPRLCARALNPSELEQLASQEPALEGLIAAWDFARETSGDKIVDSSENGHHGVCVNLPARGMTGHNWSSDIHDWRQAPGQYGAIHFHEDDLYDANWETSFHLDVPDDLPSGMYAARLTGNSDAEHVVFWVRPPRRSPTSPICFLASTATYLAYGNYRVMDCGPVYEAYQGRLLMAGAEDLFLNEHPEYSGSLYQSHSDGSGICYSSRLRPLVSMRPNTAIWQFAGDGYLLHWFDQLGYGVDVVTDEDLHLEGLELIDQYQVVVTGNHPEYWSVQMWDAVQGFLDKGGRFMYLGGNGFYWRIAYSDVFPGVIEVRRAEDGCRPWESQPGEYRLSFTGEMSGLWRRNDRTPNQLVGVGMTAQGFDRGTYYRREPGSFDPRAAFIFEGIGEQERIGDFGFAFGGASGQEIDKYDRVLGSPPHALVVATSEQHNDNMLLVSEEYASSHLMLGGTENEKVRSDMVFFETAAGGAVFSTGSISWIASVAWNECDNNVSTITRNVLDRFCDPQKFPIPDGS